MKFDRKIRHLTVQYVVLSCVIWMSIYVSGFSIQSTPHVQAQTQNTFRNPSWIDFSRSRGYTVGHTAVDFQTHFDPIVAVADGTVRTVAETSSETLAWCLANGGTQVKNPKRHFEIDHSMYRSGYTHLSSFGVNPRTALQWQVGDKIFAGELVGNSGDSGCTAGPHLHFTTWTSAGVLTNPDSPQLWSPFYPSDGFIETPVNNTTVQRVLRISGWTKVGKAFNVATSTYQPSTGGAIDHVEIWLLDPNGVNPNPRKLGDAIYGTARPDAGGDFGWYFDWDSATVPNGTYLIQPRAVARNGMTSVLNGGVSGSVTIIVQNLDKDLVGDFDGDGSIDVVHFQGIDGVWQVALSNRCSFSGFNNWITGHGYTSKNQLIGDFNGDGKGDSAVFFDNGDWYVSLSTGNSFAPFTKWITGHGYTSKNQLIGDFNGDGKDDSAVSFDNGDWYVSLSTGSSFAPFTKWMPSTNCTLPTPVTPSPTSMTPSPTPSTTVTPSPTSMTPSPTPVTSRYSVYLPMIQR